MPAFPHQGLSAVKVQCIVNPPVSKPKSGLNEGFNQGNGSFVDVTNRDAIGAKIKVATPSGRTLFNHVTASVGFLSSSDRRVHFGLGEETKAASIEIRWPSGITQKLAGVPADRILDVEEPR